MLRTFLMVLLDALCRLHVLTWSLTFPPFELCVWTNSCSLLRCDACELIGENQTFWRTYRLHLLVTTFKTSQSRRPHRHLHIIRTPNLIRAYSSLCCTLIPLLYKALIPDLSKGQPILNVHIYSLIAKYNYCKMKNS